MKFVVVAGARPNFMKVAPLIEAFKAAQVLDHRILVRLVHTGQHYDEQMSKSFFDDLDLPRPDVDLEVGSGTHAEQTGKVMIAFERLLAADRPDWVVVVGDVNSTLACSLTASKLGIRVAHVEAGLRSRDRSMPEEINRLLTDVLCDALFTTERSAGENLLGEGVDPSRIHFVGNVMIDTLLKHEQRARGIRQWEKLGLLDKNYGVLTLHRPSNVDSLESFTAIVDALESIQRELPLVFPVHPRTRKMAGQFGLWERMQALSGMRLLEPIGYLEMLSLTSHAAVVLTDSGGLQEEAVILGVPCLTLRDNTERPVTVEVGGNQIVGNRPQAIVAAVKNVVGYKTPPPQRPELWDGVAAKRIVATLLGIP